MKVLDQLDWVLISEAIYVVITLGVCLRIIYDTRSTTKTLAYLLLTIFVPVVGMIVYFAVGVNYRLNSLYSKKLITDEKLYTQLTRRVAEDSRQLMQRADGDVQQYRKLARLLVRDGYSPLVGGNRVRLLRNGEEKFADLLTSLEGAKHHIHIEYYIYEDDRIGNAIAEVLMRQARAGVQVRFIYDDFGSRTLSRKLIPALREAGVQAFPFYKLTLPAFAQRLNYRNHRKIILIDGVTSYVGGINVSDRYINSPEESSQTYWRDTHLRIDGAGSYCLQNIFLCDWNFCADEPIVLDPAYFGPVPDAPTAKGAIVQVGASGPDSRLPTLLFSFMQCINLAEREILITTPYFIPGDAILDALLVAALSGVQIKLLVPGESDSGLVNAAACSYYADLLNVGAEVHRYRRGFVHAKTMVVDGQLAAVGTANMDYRSFDLNFEVAAFVYDTELAGQLRQDFFADLADADAIDPEAWRQRSKFRRLLQKSARMVSPLL